MVYLKNKNPHDTKRATRGDIKNIVPAKKQNIKQKKNSLFFLKKKIEFVN